MARRRPKRRPKKAKQPNWLLIGGIGAAAYFFFLKPKPAVAMDIEARLEPAAPPEPTVAATALDVATMLPTLIEGMPKSYDDAKQQLGDVVALWRAKKITDPKEVDIRLGALTGAIGGLYANKTISAMQFQELSSAIADFRQEVKPTTAGTIAQIGGQLFTQFV